MELVTYDGSDARDNTESINGHFFERLLSSIDLSFYKQCKGSYIASHWRQCSFASCAIPYVSCDGSEVV